MRHPASYRQKYAQSRGQAFTYLRRREPSRWATKRQIKRLKELGVKYKRGLTWMQAKILIKEAIKQKSSNARVQARTQDDTTVTKEIRQDTIENYSMSIGD